MQCACAALVALGAAFASYRHGREFTLRFGIDEAVDLTTLIASLDQLCVGYPWRTKLDGGSKSRIKAAYGLTNYLRSPTTPGNQGAEGGETLGDRYRKLTNQLARAWALCAGSQTLEHLRVTAKSTRRSGYGWASSTPSSAG